VNFYIQFELQSMLCSDSRDDSNVFKHRPVGLDSVKLISPQRSRGRRGFKIVQSSFELLDERYIVELRCIAGEACTSDGNPDSDSYSRWCLCERSLIRDIWPLAEPTNLLLFCASSLQRSWHRVEPLLSGTRTKAINDARHKYSWAPYTV